MFWCARNSSLTIGINPAIISDIDIPSYDIPESDIKAMIYGTGKIEKIPAAD
jgi:hypothetical protein